MAQSVELDELMQRFYLQTRYNAARLSVADRIVKVAAVIESLEREMELLCLTGK